MKKLLKDLTGQTAWKTYSYFFGAPGHWPRDPKDRLAVEARRRGPERYGQELETAWERDPGHELELPYYGSERVDLTIMHADLQHGHWRRWLRREVQDADRLLGPENAIPTPEIELAKCRQAWRTRVPEELYPNAWITDRAIDAIRGFARAGRPFFVQCSYPDPHHPFTPPGRYWHMYSPDDVPAPRSFAAAHAGLAPHMRWLYAHRDAGTVVTHIQQLFACTEREAIALNYGTITQIDDGVGRIVAELARLGTAGDTVVVFTSDHGDYPGDHQLLLKRPIHYEGPIRVPFIWRDPAGPRGEVSDALTQSTDLAPTILERAGVVPSNGLHGRSLLPLFACELAERLARAMIAHAETSPYPTHIA